jgi:hypothetical protein
MAQGLTPKQRALVEHVATLDGLVELYESDSINGLSWTLRFKHEWASPREMYVRRRTSMIFAVRKPEDAKEDAAVYAARMKPRVAEAKALFLSAVAKRRGA